MFDSGLPYGPIGMPDVLPFEARIPKNLLYCASRFLSGPIVGNDYFIRFDGLGDHGTEQETQRLRPIVRCNDERRCGHAGIGGWKCGNDMASAELSSEIRLPDSPCSSNNMA